MAVDILFNSLNIGLFDNRTWVFAFFGWAYSGVDFDVPGTGGVDCLHFITACQRITESVPTSLLCILVMLLCYRHLSYPILHIGASRNTDTSFKRMLLVVMCLTWGCEIGFKLATHQMIWIFNPCHVITAVQIYLLAAPLHHSRPVMILFRLHMHMMSGTLIALLFPVTNTRQLPFETELYYLQHVLILVISFYLMHLGDPYVPEPLADFSWAATMLSLGFLYHFIFLQLLAVATYVNLNAMLCPAMSDPFHGQFYRLFAIGHQSVLILGVGKLCTALAMWTGWCPVGSPKAGFLNAADGNMDCPSTNRYQLVNGVSFAENVGSHCKDFTRGYNACTSYDGEYGSVTWTSDVRSRHVGGKLEQSMECKSSC